MKVVSYNYGFIEVLCGPTHIPLRKVEMMMMMMMMGRNSGKQN